ncbi:MAG TPA: hypothetical protein VK926_01090 [Gaiellaceae bacterium]|nr:hypothetical protein [Gaiellaceae bacterium]
MHDRRSLTALLVVAVLAALPASASGQPGVPGLASLLARHVPILVLHPQEQVRPVAVDGFLVDADLQQRTAAGWEKVEEPLPAGRADLRLDQRTCRAIDGAPATPCYVAAQAVHGSSPVVYGAAFRRGNRIALQYWLWYPWNVYSPTVPPSDLWQVHEGDWEAVSVILGRSGKPLLVGLSRHCSGARREWPKVRKRGQRPLVHVALGSHANFFAPGAHPLDPRCPNAPLLIEIIRSYGARPVDHAGSGRIVRPALIRVTASSPRWMAFAGTWGEDAYVRFPGQDPLRYGAGPRGPAFHKQWRRPLAEVLGWPQG